jgi:hypothetical protein
LRLAREGDFFRYLGLGASASICGPVVRQIERPVDERLTVPAGIGQKHPDLEHFHNDSP